MPTESGGQSPDTSAEPPLASPRSIPIPESPKNSECPSFPPVVEDHGQASNSFDQQCAPSQAPEGVRGNNGNLSYDQIHNLCKDRGYHKQDTKAALKTRLEAMDAVDRRLNIQSENAMDTSSSVSGKRGRSMGEPSAVEQTQQWVEGKRSRGDVPAITMEVDLAVVQAHAQWWPPDLKPKMEASPSEAVEGVDGAISAWVADECNRVLGQELSQEEDEMRADLAREGKRRELEAWGEFDAFSPLSACKVQKQLVDTRWALTWKMVEGRECVKARLAAKGSQDPDL